MEERKNQTCDYVSPKVRVIDVAAESVLCQSAPDYNDAGSINFDEL